MLSKLQRLKQLRSRVNGIKSTLQTECNVNSGYNGISQHEARGKTDSHSRQNRHQRVNTMTFGVVGIGEQYGSVSPNYNSNDSHHSPDFNSGHQQPQHRFNQTANSIIDSNFKNSCHSNFKNSRQIGTHNGNSRNHRSPINNNGTHSPSSSLNSSVYSSNTNYNNSNSVNTYKQLTTTTKLIPTEQRLTPSNPNYYSPTLWAERNVITGERVSIAKQGRINKKDKISIANNQYNSHGTTYNQTYGVSPSKKELSPLPLHRSPSPFNKTNKQRLNQTMKVNVDRMYYQKGEDGQEPNREEDNRFEAQSNWNDNRGSHLKQQGNYRSNNKSKINNRPDTNNPNYNRQSDQGSPLRKNYKTYHTPKGAPNSSHINKDNNKGVSSLSSSSSKHSFNQLALCSPMALPIPHTSTNAYNNHNKLTIHTEHSTPAVSLNTPLRHPNPQPNPILNPHSVQPRQRRHFLDPCIRLTSQERSNSKKGHQQGWWKKNSSNGVQGVLQWIADKSNTTLINKNNYQSQQHQQININPQTINQTDNHKVQLTKSQLEQPQLNNTTNVDKQPLQPLMNNKFMRPKTTKNSHSQRKHFGRYFEENLQSRWQL